MKYAIIFLLIAASCAICSAQDIQKLYAEAKQAYSQKNYPVFYAKIKEAKELYPYHPEILYKLGIAAALTNHPKEAVDNLKQAILINSNYSLEIDDLASLKKTSQFSTVEDLKREGLKQVVHSDTAFTIREKDLHAEGIEYDPVSETFYVGSIHKRKIIRRTRDGKVSDFGLHGVRGMTSVFGIKVSPKTNVLWACASPVPEMMNYDSAAKSALFKFELSTGKVLQRYEPSPASKGANFGDLVLNRAGDVFISDGLNNEILVLKSNQLECFFSSPEFLNIQGLAFTPDDKYLFIADYVKGVYRLEIETKKLIQLTTERDVSLQGIDGLYLHNHSLIAVQNGVSPARLTRYMLNRQMDMIVEFMILDRKHPAFGDPTLGVLVGNQFYYIANSQWGGYNADHSIKPMNELRDIVILKCKVD